MTVDEWQAFAYAAAAAMFRVVAVMATLTALLGWARGRSVEVVT